MGNLLVQHDLHINSNHEFFFLYVCAIIFLKLFLWIMHASNKTRMKRDIKKDKKIKSEQTRKQETIN